MSDFNDEQLESVRELFWFPDLVDAAIQQVEAVRGQMTNFIKLNNYYTPLYGIQKEVADKLGKREDISYKGCYHYGLESCVHANVFTNDNPNAWRKYMRSAMNSYYRDYNG